MSLNEYKWEFFDNITYTNYLLITKNFRLINLSDKLNYNWSLESFIPKDISMYNYLKCNNYGFGWCIPQFYNLYKELLDEERPFLLYHIDRKVMP